MILIRSSWSMLGPYNTKPCRETRISHDLAHSSLSDWACPGGRQSMQRQLTLRSASWQSAVDEFRTYLTCRTWQSFVRVRSGLSWKRNGTPSRAADGTVGRYSTAASSSSSSSSSSHSLQHLCCYAHCTAQPDVSFQSWPVTQSQHTLCCNWPRARNAADASPAADAVVIGLASALALFAQHGWFPLLAARPTLTAARLPCSLP